MTWDPVTIFSYQRTPVMAMMGPGGHYLARGRGSRDDRDDKDATIQTCAHADVAGVVGALVDAGGMSIEESAVLPQIGVGGLRTRRGSLPTPRGRSRA